MDIQTKTHNTYSPIEIALLVVKHMNYKNRSIYYSELNNIVFLLWVHFVEMYGIILYSDNFLLYDAGVILESLNGQFNKNLTISYSWFDESLIEQASSKFNPMDVDVILSSLENYMYIDMFELQDTIRGNVIYERYYRKGEFTLVSNYDALYALLNK